MSSLYLPHRRKSPSARSSPTQCFRPTFNDAHGRRPALKRSQPASPSSSQRRGSFSGKCTKRRRRESSPADISTICSSNNTLTTVTPSSSSGFATTPDAFRLCSKHNYARGPPAQADTRATMIHTDLENAQSLHRLHSNAFGELRRSVTENGEGLVLRMREYETARSHSGVHAKARAAEKRTRKKTSHPGRVRKTPAFTGASDDEDIIWTSSGRASHDPVFSSSSLRQRCTLAEGGENDYHMMDDSDILSSFKDTERSSPSMELDNISSMDMSDDECNVMSRSSPTQSLNSSLPRLPSLSVVPPNSPCSRRGIPSRPISPSLPTSQSDKAIAALTLAMANGTGSLTDYSALLALQGQNHDSSIDFSHAGEMWS